jgi:3-hydroxyisobutyrate dehydrogenase-like beta-hydroxyacid dehydrogenase
VANSTLFGVLGVLGEALALGTALGLAAEAAYRLLDAAGSAGRAAPAGARGGRVPALDYTAVLAQVTGH